MVALALTLAGCSGAGVDASRNAIPEEVPAVAAGAEMSAAKAAFESGNFGYAVRYFQLVRQAQPDSLEACLGLAASYDWLYRFDRSDPTYGECEEVGADKFFYHNNVGFSHLLRGDFGRASVSFSQADALRPGHPVVAANLEILRDVSGG